MREGPDERRLRAKYLDWCSARIAEQIERMSADDMFALSRDVQAPPSGTEGAHVVGGTMDYAELLKKVTFRMAEDLGLPDFGDWIEMYRQDPDSYERDLLGFTLEDRRN
jgi:hypothetical protein